MKDMNERPFDEVATIETVENANICYTLSFIASSLLIISFIRTACADW